MFGEAEVLVAAKDLVNDRSVRRVAGGDVEYIHLLFDRHQIVLSEGLATESFHPGPQTLAEMPAEALAELLELFPMLNPETGEGYGPPARPPLRSFEARALIAAPRQERAA